MQQALERGSTAVERQLPCRPRTTASSTRSHSSADLGLAVEQLEVWIEGERWMSEHR
jgi:hypothetical protein